MQKIAIITDSSSDIPKDLLEKYNISSVPFRVIFSDKEYEDQVNISPEQLYARLKDEIPTTSLPSQESIEKLLTKLENEGYTHVISINISFALSGTGNSVRLLLEEHPKLTGHVFDSKTVSAAQGIIALDAAKMVQEGKSFEEIVEVLPSIRKRTQCFFTIDTLLYLKKGGRIGKVAGTIGEMLNLKPIIHVGDDGIYHTHAKARGKKQALKKIEDILKEYISKGPCNIWVIDGGAPESGDILYNAAMKMDNIASINRGVLGSALGVHTGPGLAGYVIQEVE